MDEDFYEFLSKEQLEQIRKTTLIKNQEYDAKRKTDFINREQQGKSKPIKDSCEDTSKDS